MKQIEDGLLERFKKLVESHIGLCIRQTDNETFRKALITEMKRLNMVDPDAYLSFLKSDTGESKQEWKSLIISTTTGESYFFRDKGHFSLLQNTILPELIKNKGPQGSLRIWSAGCSTGEEPYSVAILLDSLLPDPQGWDILIIGTDINEESLKRAERGVYTKWSFRMVDKGTQERYFKGRQDEWEIHEKIKRMVKFRYGNLIEDGFFLRNLEIHDIDLIVCRNVFIYFNKEAVSSVFNKFIKILNYGGYLITGHGELYGLEPTGLGQIMYPEAVIYKKTAELRGHAREIASFPKGLKEKKELKKNWGKPVLKSASFVPDSSKTLNPRTGIEELIKQGHYTEAIEKVESYLHESKDKHDMLCLIAHAYANSGEYEKAETLCRKAIRIDAGSADPYFLLAHVEEAKGNDEEAKVLFKKAIYLNPSFIAAYCELGGLYEKDDDIPRAGKARTAAIEILESLPCQMPVKPYDITAGELLKYVKYLIGSEEADLIQSAREEKVSR